MQRKQDIADTLQAIEDQKTYPMQTFMKTVGWGRHALRQARQKGLRVVRVSGRCFVRGKDFSEFLGRIGDEGVNA